MFAFLFDDKNSRQGTLRVRKKQQYTGSVVPTKCFVDNFRWTKCCKAFQGSSLQFHLSLQFPFKLMPFA